MVKLITKPFANIPPKQSLHQCSVDGCANRELTDETIPSNNTSTPTRKEDANNVFKILTTELSPACLLWKYSSIALIEFEVTITITGTDVPINPNPEAITAEPPKIHVPAFNRYNHLNFVSSFSPTS